MGTHGNLELRLGGETLYASVNQNGEFVFGAVASLCDFLDKVEQPTNDQYKEWFKNTADGLWPEHSDSLHEEYQEANEGLKTAHEVIIDASRRLILYNNDPGEDDFADNLIEHLSAKHKFEGHRFTKRYFRDGAYDGSPVGKVIQHPTED
ncbi:MAG: hypothetical protein V3V78_05055 [Candidatus Woesearchaeota archaeon]